METILFKPIFFKQFIFMFKLSESRLKYQRVYSVRHDDLLEELNMTYIPVHKITCLFWLQDFINGRNHLINVLNIFILYFFNLKYL